MIIDILPESQGFTLIGGPGCPECGHNHFEHRDFVVDGRVTTRGECVKCHHKYVIKWCPSELAAEESDNE